MCHKPTTAYHSFRVMEKKNNAKLRNKIYTLIFEFPISIYKHMRFCFHFFFFISKRKSFPCLLMVIGKQGVFFFFFLVQNENPFAANYSVNSPLHLSSTSWHFTKHNLLCYYYVKGIRPPLLVLLKVLYFGWSSRELQANFLLAAPH